MDYFVPAHDGKLSTSHGISMRRFRLRDRREALHD
jgi:hypothetical protein